MNAADSAPRIRRGLFRKLLILAAVFAGVIIGFLGVEHWRGARHLAAWEAGMRARGEPTSLINYIPPLRAGANGAPELQVALGRLPGSNQISLRLPASMRLLPSGRGQSLVGTTHWPKPVEAWDRRTTNPPVVLGPAHLAADIAAAGDALIRIHAALRHTNFDFGLRYHLAGAMPPLAQIKIGAAWMRAAAIDAVIRRDFETAVTRLEDGAALARTLKAEPWMISQLVRLRIGESQVTAVWEALTVPGWDDRQLARIQATLQGGNNLQSMRSSIPMERLYVCDLFERPETNHLVEHFGTINKYGLGINEEPKGFLGSFGAEGQAVADFVGRRVAYPLWLLAWADQDRLQTCRYWEAVDAVIRAHEPQAGILALTQALGRIEVTFTPASAYDRVRFRITAQLHDEAVVDRFLGGLRLDTQCALASAAAALHRFRLQHGQFPRSLGELVPKFAPDVPLDPMDGQPLRYRLKSEGHFELWSVACNGQDDGGVSRKPAAGVPGKLPFAWNEACLDWIWPEPATPEEIRDSETNAGK